MTVQASVDLDQAGLCPGCFQQKGQANPCPHCGFDVRAPRPANALSPGTVLNDQFIIGRVLGKPGGFGIAYLAMDRHLKNRVAIKEYLPRDLAARAGDRTSIVPHTADEAGLFRFGLEQFLREGRTLAGLDHPNLVRVRQFFEANGSAYLVMDYYQGLTLAEYLERQPGGRLAEQTALTLIQPVLDGLRAVHAAGFLHRDLKPANIYLARTEGGGARPVLIDFGAAREAMGERSRSLSVVLTEGYAPFEQYHRRGRQGPWSDVYAASAVLYRMLTGRDPPPATERVAQDELQPALAFGVSPAVSAALARGLGLRPEDRPQTVAEFQRLLRDAQRGDAPVLDPDWERGGSAPQPLVGGSRAGLVSTRGGAAERDWPAIIGPRATAFYVERFQRFEANGGGARAGWNWPAFLFDVLWMFYRRMWGTGLALMGLSFVLGVLVAILLAATGMSDAEAEGVMNLSFLPLKVLIGMFGSWLYYRRARRLIRKADERFPQDPVARAGFLQARGGTSLLFLWLLLIPVIGILAAIAIPSYQDYTLKARLSEVLSGAAPHKLAVAEYAINRGQWPRSEAVLELPMDLVDPDGITYAVEDGVVIATITDEGELNSGEVRLTPAAEDGAITWRCASPNIPQRLLPAACRD